jgi:hypothetical protein
MTKIILKKIITKKTMCEMIVAIHNVILNQFNIKKNKIDKDNFEKNH